MTLNGAIMQLVELRENSMMPEALKSCFDKVIETISECEEPSAKPEQKWIPCSERLPEVNKEPYAISIQLCKDEFELYESEPVLVTIKVRGGERIGIATYTYDSMHPEDVMWNGCFDDYEVDSDNVIAWMPLPEPYKGEL